MLFPPSFGFDLIKTIWLDIEVVPAEEKFANLSKEKQELFKKRFDKKIAAYQQENALESKELATPLFYNTEGAFHAEYGSIICISIGVIIKNKKGEPTLFLKSFYGDNEKQIIHDFYSFIEENMKGQKPKYNKICGHYIKNYDMPMILKRGLIHQVLPPAPINPIGKKPWELDYLLDTWEVWKVGGFNTSGLDALCNVFNVPSPKDDISGADVRNVYYNNKDLASIVKYCEKDVASTCGVTLAMNCLDVISENRIKSKTKF